MPPHFYLNAPVAVQSSIVGSLPLPVVVCFAVTYSVPVSDLLVGALSLLLATNTPVAVSNLVTRAVGAPVLNVEADPRAAALREVMLFDDDMEEALEALIRHHREGSPSDPTRPTRAEVEVRMEEQFERVNRKYRDFLSKYPDYAPGRVAYASFLEENGEFEKALAQLKEAVHADPTSAPAWNNLANHYGHYGGVEHAFPAYEKAIELRPFEALYHYNYATTVFLFRKDAAEYYQCDEQEVFERALQAYRKVRELRPDNFRYAFDYAQTYYGVKPAPADTEAGKREAAQAVARNAIQAWKGALAIADNDIDRQGIHLHLARWYLKLQDWEEVRMQLALVQHEQHQSVKERLERNLAAQESGLETP